MRLAGSFAFEFRSGGSALETKPTLLNTHLRLPASFQTFFVRSTSPDAAIRQIRQRTWPHEDFSFISFQLFVHGASVGDVLAIRGETGEMPNARVRVRNEKGVGLGWPTHENKRREALGGSDRQSSCLFARFLGDDDLLQNPEAGEGAV